MHYLIKYFDVDSPNKLFYCIFEIDINTIITRPCESYKILRVVKGNDKLIFSTNKNGIGWDWIKRWENGYLCYGSMFRTDKLIELNDDEDLELWIKLQL